MILYIDGKSHSNESDILGAIKNLPSPFLDVITDFDDKIYTIFFQEKTELMIKKPIT
ncbi:MAG: hypothetical protein sL5_11010 [Candidatus Mesenet longicola]|uniref:Uncharacterized protein n=1 Tax=Candidatus Mesenet longicola TaxID=1892558 RepID=A0A8J3MPJ3_9RICK|nr:MAG: hypothetical protein sGL2_11420 [Candidatus Mesenet longicola]GHM60108.1 MAG: hypothetical protein sL5_11010 [Candidatus Mesenet longicola]